MTEDTPETAEMTEALAPLRAALQGAASLPPPVTDFGPVRLELMGHRYREGRLSETVIAGQPFLRLDLEGGGFEYYRPDAVYCISPVAFPVPRAEIPASLVRALDDDRDDDDDDLWSDDDV
jgi:hypothetical protein